MLRQNHPIVGLTAESFSLVHFGGESKYIHLLRLVGLCVEDIFQERVREIILPLNGQHQSQGIKSDRDMRDDARTAGSHRSQQTPCSAHTLDVLKCKE